MRDVVIVDSGGANLASVCFAFERLGARALVTRDAARIASATRVVLPGVGAAQHAMSVLRRASLDALVPALRVPVLGICLGMQLLFESSEEGETPCLGPVPGRVRRFDASAGLPVPHMGWNTLHVARPCSLLDGLSPGTYVYFVHSYAARDSADAVATTEYGCTFASAVARENFFGVQFHPERSGAAGARILRNFLEMGEA